MISDKVLYAKGKRGIIHTATYNGKKIAIKSANPESKAINRIENEANFLKKLNEFGIGAKLIFFRDGQLGMEFIEGKLFEDYIQESDKKEILQIIKNMLEQLYQMDKLGIIKEEMHHPFKHIIIDKTNKPIQIDFERCRYSQKPKNVSQFVQYLTNNRISMILELKKIDIRREEMLAASGVYKKDINKQNLKAIIELIE